MLAPLFDEVEARGERAGVAAPLRASLKQLLREITLCDLSLERLCTDVQLWLQMQRRGLEMHWVTELLGRYQNTLAQFIAADAATKDGSWERSLIALQKLIMFHLGFVTQSFLSEVRAAYYYNSLHDPDSGLPNQILLVRMLREALLGRSSQDQLFAVMRLRVSSLHRFLGYPGYPTIEQLMAAVAERLSDAMRPADVIGQLGKTELGILLPQLRSEGQIMLAANKIFRTLEPAFLLGNLEFTVRPVIGVALSPKHGNDADLLFRLAETAQQLATISSESYAIYTEELDADERLHRSLETELRSALRENELMLYYQPQLDLRSGKVCGCEALLRWKNSRGEFVPPNVIVSAAEQCGLMFELTQWIVNTAVRHGAEFLREGIDVAVSVNLSASDLLSRELVDTIEQSLRTWGTPPGNLLLEITESSMIVDMDKALVVLERLKRVGVELSIDDFGTGYSSLVYLKRLPIHELKIDQLFVRQMLKVREDERIVRTVIDLAHNLDLRVVAEGVEDAETLAALRVLECDTIQGYVLSRPLPQADFKLWWRKQQANT